MLTREGSPRTLSQNSINFTDVSTRCSRASRSRITFINTTESTTEPHILYIRLLLEPQTSTSFMTGTGLKKCSPPNLSFLSVTLAISVIDREEVLDAKIVDLKMMKK